MNLYQMGLYRIGQQGSNSGWQLVSPSMGISPVASERFEELASAIFEVRSSLNVPYCRGLFVVDNFAFFTNLNFNAKGEDERGVSYAHCYCFTMSDYLELAKNPEKIAYVLEETFPMEYDASIEEYPVEHDFKGEAMDVMEILAKYGISLDTYKEMVLGAICAAMGKSSPLCIKKALNSEEYIQFYKDILYVVMKGMPIRLRTKLSSFSFREGKFAALYVSDEVNSDNYIDMDANVVEVQYAALKKFEFTMLYNNMINTGTTRVLDGFWELIEAQMESTIDGPLRELQIEHVESAFQAVRKNLEAGSIDPANVMSLLTAFLGFKLKNSAESAAYLSELVNIINENGMEVTDSVIKKGLSDFYEKTEDEEFQKQMDILNVRGLLKSMERTQAYDELDNMRANRPEMYKNVYDFILKGESDFAYDYYVERILPGELVSYDAIYDHMDRIVNEINVEGGIAVSDQVIEKDYTAVVDAILKLANAKMSAANSWSELVNAYDDAKAAIAKVPTALPAIEKACKAVKSNILVKIWDYFQLDWFEIDPNVQKQYDRFNYKGFVEKPNAKATTQNPVYVKQLCELTSGDYGYDFPDRVKSFVYTDEIPMSGRKKNEIREILLNEWLRECTGGFGAAEEIDIDTLLCLCYDTEKKHFLAKAFFEHLADLSHGKCFENMRINRNVQKSETLRDEYTKQLFIQDATRYLERYKGSNAIDAKGVKKYIDVLSGKELKDEKTLENTSNFFTTLYKTFIFDAAVCSLVLFAKALKDYVGFQGVMSIVMFAVVLVVIALLMCGTAFFEIKRSYGLGGALKDKTIDQIPTLAMFVAALVVPMLAFLVVGLLHKFTVGVILTLCYVLVGLGIMVVSDFFRE